MRFKKSEVWSADFETTTQKNYEKDGCVRVWLWSLVSVDLYYKLHGNTIDTFLEQVKLFALNGQCRRVFFFNLRFDGSFIVDHLLRIGAEYGKHFETIIDGMNIWYSVRIYWTEDHKCYTEFFDGTKKFPGMNLEGVAEMYDVQGKTLQGEHKKEVFDLYRPEGYEPTKEEIDYCINDSVIQAHAIASEMENNHIGMTLSSDAFKDVRGKLCRLADPKNAYPLAWRKLLPELSPEWDEWVRQSYKGGWVYVNPEYEGLELNGVTVFDVNSLYPSVMYNARLPVGHPYWKVKPRDDELYIIQVDVMFKLKKGKLPTLQVKNDPLYNATEYLTEDKGPTTVCMTCIDWEMFIDHYDVEILSVPRYCCFRSRVGLLRTYIDYWMDIKKQSKGGSSERYIAKRYLNSPYGKMGMRMERINKIPMLDAEGDVVFDNVEEMGEGVYLPYATFVTAAARYITISAAQKCMDDGGRFIYADTDSIHILGDAPEGLWVDQKELGAWKCEGRFEKAKYLRPKTYIHCHEDYSVYTEEKVHKDGRVEIVPEGIKCAGMPDNIKLKLALDEDKAKAWKEFYISNKFPGKKMQCRVPGGILIRETTYELKEQIMRSGCL